VRELRNPWNDYLVHRIYVFTEHGLTPNLVKEFFKETYESGCRYVLDPFVGSGTVLIEAQRLGIISTGIDVNPWGLLVSRAKTTYPVGIEKFLDTIDFEDSKVLIPSDRLKEYHTIRVLRALGKIRSGIENAPEHMKPLLFVIFVKLAESISLLRKSPAPRFDSNKRFRDIKAGEVFEEYRNEILKAKEDLDRHRFLAPVYLIFADSTVWLPDRVCSVLTSPPFANNVDYVRHSQLALLWLGYAKDSQDLGRLRSMQIPSCEAAARRWRPSLYEDWLLPYLSSIRGSRAHGYRKFLTQYLYAMKRHFELLKERLEWEAWYTIGDSILGGAYIPTHEFLRKIAEEVGFKAKLTVIGQRFRPGRMLYLLRLINKR